jgi:SecD-like export protein/PASTA domain-containing protein
LGEEPCSTLQRAQGPGPGAAVLKDRDGATCYIVGPTLLTGAGVDQATPEIDPSTSAWIVQVHFKNDDFVTKVAQPYVGKQIAIVVDGVVFAAPTINQGISGRDVQIAGNFTQLEAEQLAARLLGVPVSQVTVPTVEPSTTVPIVSPPVTGPSTSPTTKPSGNVNTVTVPNLVLMYPPDALNALQSIGLHGTLVDKCVVRYQSDVQGTDPPAGSLVARGSNVVVYVGIVCDPNSTVPTPTTIGSTTPGT